MPNVPTTPGYDEFDEEEAEDIVQAIPDGASGDASDLGDHILRMFGDLAMLQVRLEEMDEDDFKIVRVRLALLRGALTNLPTAPRPRRVVGFRPPTAGGVVLSSKTRPRRGTKRPAKRGKR